MVHLSISVSYVFFSSCLGFRWEVLDLKNTMSLYTSSCSFIDGNRKHVIHNILEGRSGEEKTRNGRVAEQVAGRFCFAGPERTCLLHHCFSHFSDLRSSILPGFHGCFFTELVSC